MDYVDKSDVEVFTMKLTLVMYQREDGFTFTFMHLADAFIQSNLQCIQAIQFIFFISMSGFFIRISQ